MKIDSKLNLIKLYDIYYQLLTTRQQEIFELYFDDDYSISEISEELNITSAGVSKTIKVVQKKLLELEEQLKIETNYQYNIKLLESQYVEKEIINKIKK